MTQTSTTVGCPVCDAVYALPLDMEGQSAQCGRCGFQLTARRPAAIGQVVGLSITMAALMVIVIFTPFLTLRSGQFEAKASVYDTILGFSTGIMVPLAVAVFLFILVLPIMRMVLLVYALTPMLIGRRNFPQAARALRYAFTMRPWAMAEIFMVGVAVALVKLAGLATISMGMAFWAFGAVVLISAYQDTFMCRNTLWTMLDANG
ncbi:MAG: paraquat-inducible protein A [Pseudomonadota bacterium]